MGHLVSVDTYDQLTAKLFSSLLRKLTLEWRLSCDISNYLLWFSLSVGECFMQAKIINVFIIFDASLHSYTYRPFYNFNF